MKRLRLKCGVNKERIDDAKLRNYGVFVTAGPRRPFSAAELDALRDAVFDSAKSVFVMLGKQRGCYARSLIIFVMK